MFQRQSTLEVPAHLDLRENVCTPWRVQNRGMAGPSSESTAAAAAALAAERGRDRFDAAAALYRKCGTSNPVFALVRPAEIEAGEGGEGGEGGGSGTGRSSSPSYSSTLRFCAVRLPFIFIREERPAPPAGNDRYYLHPYPC